MYRRSSLKYLFNLLAPLVLLFAGLPAQADQTCTWSEVSDSNRQQITCGDAFTMERESGTDITILESSGDVAPRTIELKNGGILIEVTPGSAPTQIRTPHAIAAVRGTIYVVDAMENSTSVFVLKGSVAVNRIADAATVTLGAGQGIDVGDGFAFTVTEWPADRAAALLARFGR